MTSAPRVPRLAFAGIDDVAAALRRGGGRLSSTRRLVLEALFAAPGPVSAEHIAQGLDGRLTRLDVASVYRTLERLEALGAVRHVHIGHGPGLYALAGEEEREYLVCERCDRVTSVGSARMEAVRAQIREDFGYHARFSHFPILGLCPRCADHTHTAHEHDYEHSHRDRVHSHPHLHETGPQRDRQHEH